MAQVQASAAVIAINEGQISATGLAPTDSNRVGFRTILNPCDSPTLDDNGTWDMEGSFGALGYTTSDCSQGAGCLDVNVLDPGPFLSPWLTLSNFEPANWCAYDGGHVLLDVYSEADPQVTVSLFAAGGTELFQSITGQPGQITHTGMNTDISVTIDFSAGTIQPCSYPLSYVGIRFDDCAPQHLHIDNIRVYRP